MQKISNYDTNKIKVSKIWNIIFILMLSLIAGAFLFGYFILSTQARNMLREGKNVLLAFDMISIEYYGQNKEIYNSDKRNGLADGVAERIEAMSGEKGTIFITSYSYSKREVTGFIYERNNFRVSYSQDKEGNSYWDIDYVFNVLSYDTPIE